MNTLQKALVSIEGSTFEDSQDMLNTIEKLNKKYPTLQSGDWIQLLKIIQVHMVSGFKLESRRKGREVDMGNREDIHTDLECVMDTLSHIKHNSEFEKVDVLIINKAVELIDSVAWKYKEDE